MKVNKDFYSDLPGGICIILDGFITKYGKEDWFEKAWGEYRQHIKESSMDDMKMPGYVFGRYIAAMEAKGKTNEKHEHTTTSV